MNYIYNKDEYWREEELMAAQLNLDDLPTTFMHEIDVDITNCIAQFLSDYQIVESHQELKQHLKKLIDKLNKSIEKIEVDEDDEQKV